ncbi:MAG: peptidase P60 [Nitrospirales bacterium]|nr:MAG: peptidase P60 [Nitrospirales bacterium]
MKIMMAKLTCVVLLMFVGGCQSVPRHTTNPIGIIHASTTVTLSNEDAVKRSLYAQLEEWDDVEYDYGGLSKDGVDCSGFVFLTYQSHFGVTLPRTAAQQSSVGRPVAQRHLRPGDLVFFKIGRRTQHVGIFVEGRQFIHASKSRGVMMSSLDDVYWSKKYWKAKRVETRSAAATDIPAPSVHDPTNVGLAQSLLLASVSRPAS